MAHLRVQILDPRSEGPILGVQIQGVRSEGSILGGPDQGVPIWGLRNHTHDIPEMGPQDYIAERYHHVILGVHALCKCMQKGRSRNTPIWGPEMAHLRVCMI